MTAESVRSRIVEADDAEYVDSLVSDSHQEVYWRGWVVLYTKSNAAAKKERILVITNFRLFTVKHGLLQRSTRQSFSILELCEISAARNRDDEIHLSFGKEKDKEVDIQSDNVVAIAQAVLFAYKAISYGLPKDKLPKVDLPPRFLESFLPPEPDTQDGLLASYMAACDFLSIAPKLPVLDYFMACFETNDRLLNLSECFELVNPLTTEDVQAVAHALAYTDWFTEVHAVDLPLRDEGMNALHPMLQLHLSKLLLVNAKAGAKGFASLFERMTRLSHRLTYLNISKNSIGDSGLRSAVDAFKAAKHVVETLCLQQCGLGSKGVAALSDDLLVLPEWRRGLKVLDLSDNALGRAGSQSLAEFLNRAEGLEQLHLMRADIAPEVVLSALLGNKRLVGGVLTTLNLSGNKLSTAMQQLCGLLTQSSSMTFVYLIECSLKAAAVAEVLQAAVANPHGVRFWLEFSRNEIGEKGAAEVAEVLNRLRGRLEPLHTLILNSMDLGAEGVIALLAALTGAPVHTLSLDCNIKRSLFGNKAQQAGEALAKFLLSTKALRELSVAGDDNFYLKEALHPLLAALKSNPPLEYIDVSANRLGDEGMRVLAESLVFNRALTSFTADRNRIGMPGLRDLHRALIANTAVQAWTIPELDIRAVFKSASASVVRELRSIMSDFDACMERNASIAREHDKQPGGVVSYNIPSSAPAPAAAAEAKPPAAAGSPSPVAASPSPIAAAVAAAAAARAEEKAPAAPPVGAPAPVDTQVVVDDSLGADDASYARMRGVSQGSDFEQLRRGTLRPPVRKAKRHSRMASGMLADMAQLKGVDPDSPGDAPDR
jgi:Ran GTPase-activating protein (RanGAP) involved in mRNA processing and transport